jgi:hypothetical protein
MIRRIRELLYEQGFTISGARNRLQELGHAGGGDDLARTPHSGGAETAQVAAPPLTSDQLRSELEEIRALLLNA